MCISYSHFESKFLITVTNDAINEETYGKISPCPLIWYYGKTTASSVKSHVSHRPESMFKYK
jgi:hypothetical protein